MKPEVHEISKRVLPARLPNMFLCSVIERIGGAKGPIEKELDTSLGSLSRRFQVPVEFAGGTAVVASENEREPQRIRYESEAEYDEAMEGYTFDAKPWLLNTTTNVEETLRFLRERFAHSRLKDITSLDEHEHERWTSDFAAFIGQCLNGKVTLYESDMNADPQGLEQNGYSCVFDQTLAVVDDEHIVLIWHGREGYWG